jgi:hypothetical protein
MSQAFKAILFLLEPVGMAGVLVPFLLSAGVMVLAWRRHAPIAGGLWGGALALGAAYLAGAVVIGDWPPIPPGERIHWLFYLAVGATGFGLCEALGSWPAWGRWSLRLYFVFTAVWLLLRPLMVNEQWEVWASFVRLGGICLAGLAFWGALDALAQRLPGVSLPLCLMAVTSGTALVLALSGALPWARLEVTLLAALGGSLLVAWFNPRLRLARGASAVLVAVLPGIWLLGFFYAEVSLGCVLLLALGTLAPWLGQHPWITRRAPWQAVFFRVAVVLLPVAWAVARAYSAFPGTEDL